MAPRKNAKKAAAPRSRKARAPASPTLLSRAARRVALTFLTLALGAGAWAVYIYLRTPTEDRNLKQVVGTAVDRAEGLYARVPKSSEPLKKLPDLLPGGGDSSTDPNAEAGTLERPFLIARVIRVADGDTLVVETGGKEERVRLLRVNTPESVHPDTKKNIPAGKTASDYTKRRLSGRQVRLQYEPGGDERDRYGRLLCYVFVEDQNFNVELVEEGLSPYYTEYGRSKEFDKNFESAERSAREGKRGIWGDPELAAEYTRLKKKWAALPNSAWAMRPAA